MSGCLAMSFTIGSVSSSSNVASTFRKRPSGTYAGSWSIPLGRYETIEAELDELLTEPMVTLIAKHTDMTSSELHAAAHEAVVELAELAETTYSSGSIIEISATGVTKAFGLERVATERGIDAADVVAFGDMPNDIPMLAWAGRGVAVANAHAEVLAIADEVTAANDDDGVAAVIERLLAD